MNNYCKELDEIIYCPQCGSTNITGVYHVNINTKEVLDLFGMYENYWCEDCESDIGSGMTLRQLWEAFSEVPVDNNDDIEEDFLGFECGTGRFEVLRWFDERCPNGIKKDLMGSENDTPASPCDPAYKEFKVNDEYSITRVDYLSMPSPMLANRFTNEQMERLAELVAAGMKKTETCSKDKRDEIFWQEMEECAVSMGMVYLEDLTEEEQEKEDLL